MSKPAGRRLFFALWPEPAVRRALAERAARARGQPAAGETQGKMVPDANLHLTLAFLGKVPLETIPDVVAAAGALSLPGFELSIDRQGWWKKSGILWLGPSAPPAALNRLVKALWAGLEPLGFWSDFRDFHPHVTVARRCARGARGAVAPVTWRVAGFALMISDLDHKGATYRVHEAWPLNPS